MPVTHAFVSGKADSGDATLIRPSNWNAGHTISVTEETPTGTINGVNDTFTLSSAGSFRQIYKNGILMREGTAYSRVGVTITFNSGYIPQTGDNLHAIIW